MTTMGRRLAESVKEGERVAVRAMLPGRCTRCISEAHEPALVPRAKPSKDETCASASASASKRSINQSESCSRAHASPRGRAIIGRRDTLAPARARTRLRLRMRTRICLCYAKPTTPTRGRRAKPRESHDLRPTRPVHARARKIGSLSAIGLVCVCNRSACVLYDCN